MLTTSGRYPWSQTRSWTGKGRPHSNLIFLREPHIPITIFCLASFKVSVFDLSCVEAFFTSGPAVIWCQILLSIDVDKVMLDLK